MLIGEYLCRVLMVLVGYAAPAYFSYKAVCSNKQEQLRTWCIYWLVLGFFMSVEWIADYVIFWVPMYYEAKLVFVVLCWHPRTQGAVYLFEHVVQPLLQTHEARIDQVVEEAKLRMADSVSSQINRARSYVQDNAGGLLEGMRKFSQEKGSNLEGSAPHTAAGAAHGAAKME